MTILGIDPATTTGFAIVTGDKKGRVVTSGARLLDVDGHPGRRFNALWGFLVGLINGNGIGLNLIAYERAFHRGAKATEYHHGYCAVIQLVAAQHRIPVLALDNRQVKKHATGCGSASKGEMVWMADKQFHVKATPDEADAIWIADLARVRQRTP